MNGAFYLGITFYRFKTNRKSLEANQRLYIQVESI